MIRRRTRFANAGDINSRTILQRASVLTGAASDATGGVNAGLLEDFELAVGVDHFGGLQVNGFGRSGAPLFANDALGGHGPRQASAAIIEGGADVNGLGIGGNADRPSFFFGGDFPDGAGGAGFGAQCATGLAIADAGNEDRSPNAFETGFRESGMKRVIRADLHAFAAANTAGEKIGFFEGARGANPFLVLLWIIDADGPAQESIIGVTPDVHIPMRPGDHGAGTIEFSSHGP